LLITTGFTINPLVGLGVLIAIVIVAVAIDIANDNNQLPNYYEAKNKSKDKNEEKDDTYTINPDTGKKESKNNLPTEGKPNSTDHLYNGDGSIKKTGWYGGDGKIIHERNYNHTGTMDFPHDHTWDYGNNSPRRSKGHLPPFPDYVDPEVPFK